MTTTRLIPIVLCLIGLTSPAHAKRPRRPRGGACSEAVTAKLDDRAIGLRGEGPGGEIYAAVLRTRGRVTSLAIHVGPTELSPRVGDFKLPPFVARALAAGDLASVDGIVIVAPDQDQTLTFRIDGRDHRQNPRLELKVLSATGSLKISGASPWRDGKMTH